MKVLEIKVKIITWTGKNKIAIDKALDKLDHYFVDEHLYINGSGGYIEPGLELHILEDYSKVILVKVVNNESK